MPRNPHRPGSSASTSFREREIDWLDQVLAALRRGASASVLMRSPEATSVARKVQSMQRSLERNREAHSEEPGG